MKRDLLLILFFGIVAVCCLALVGWRVVGESALPESAYQEISVVPQQSGELSIAIAGDTMFGDGAQDLIETRGIFAPLQGVVTMLSDADVGVVNMEAPITAATEQLNSGAQFSYASQPEAATALSSIGVKVLQLGNNHTMDRADVGLADTIALANRAGMVTIGAGLDRMEAIRPVLIRTDDLTVALVSFGEDYGSAKRAGDGVPGMVPFSAEAIIYAEQVARRAGADRVVALVHWGDNYAEVNDLQRYWASELIAAGYDAIVGSGPHILQEIEVIDGVPVIYSLGNFAFGAPGRFASFGHSGLGAVAILTFTVDGGTLTVRCICTDNLVVNYVARECTPEETVLAASELKGGLVWNGSVGTLRF